MLRRPKLPNSFEGAFLKTLLEVMSCRIQDFFHTVWWQAAGGISGVSYHQPPGSHQSGVTVLVFSHVVTTLHLGREGS